MTLGDGGDRGFDVLFKVFVRNGERRPIETFNEVDSATLCFLED
jgi:hypothetical protein